MPPGPIVLISFVLGFALMWPLGWIFDVMHWPIFHSWGLVHGSFIVAWPALTGISFLCIYTIEKIRQMKQNAPSEEIEG